MRGLIFGGGILMAYTMGRHIYRNILSPQTRAKLMEVVSEARTEVSHDAKKRMDMAQAAAKNPNPEKIESNVEKIREQVVNASKDDIKKDS